MATRSRPSSRRTPSRALERTVALLRTHLMTQRAPGDRLPPVRELARRLDCGETNLLRASQRLVGEGLLVARPGMGTYVTDAVETMRDDAQGGAVLRGKTIDVLTAAGADDVVREMLGNLITQITESGGRSRLLYRPDELGQEKTPPVIEPSDADAVIVAELHRDWPLRVAGDQPLLVISSRPVAVDRSSRFDVVLADVEQAGRLAGEYARTRGFASACFVGSNPHTRLSDRRYDPAAALAVAGFELGWGEPLSPQHRIHRQLNAPDGGAAAVANYLALESPPQLVVTSCDELAIGFIHGLRAHGLAVGKDVAVIGIGGLMRGRQLVGSPLTTIEPDWPLMTHEAMRLLVARLADPDRAPRRIALGCSLFESAACSPSTRRR